MSAPLRRWWWFSAHDGGYQPCLHIPISHKTLLCREICTVFIWPDWHAHCASVGTRTYEPTNIQTQIYLSTKEDAMSEFKSGFFVGGEACEGRVLVVDDEPDIRKVVKMTLEKSGYEVIEAENGEKAIDVINSGENRLLLDVVICDIRMPKINGAEAVAYFRSNYPRVPL